MNNRASESAFATNNDEMSKANEMPKVNESSPSIAQADSKPSILILGLGDDASSTGEASLGTFDPNYGDLIDSLTNYHICRENTPEGLLKSLAEIKPMVILAVDTSLIAQRNLSVLNAVKEYTAAGGTVLFVAGFGDEWLISDKKGSWFKEQWGLQWSLSGYYHINVRLNKNHTILNITTLPSIFRGVKTMMIRGVRKKEAIYHTTNSSGHLYDEVPAAFTKYKDGWIGYLCSMDVDQEEQPAVKLICEFAESQSKREVSVLEDSQKQELEGDEIEFADSQEYGEVSVLEGSRKQELGGDESESRSSKRRKTKKANGQGIAAEKKFLFPCRFFKQGACKKGADCTFRHD